LDRLKAVSTDFGSQQEQFVFGFLQWKLVWDGETQTLFSFQSLEWPRPKEVGLHQGEKLISKGPYRVTTKTLN